MSCQDCRNPALILMEVASRICVQLPTDLYPVPAFGKIIEGVATISSDEAGLEVLAGYGPQHIVSCYGIAPGQNPQNPLYVEEPDPVVPENFQYYDFVYNENGDLISVTRLNANGGSPELQTYTYNESFQLITISAWGPVP